MGKAASKVTRVFGFGKKPGDDELDGPPGSKPQQWDTTIDELFGDVQPGNDINEQPDILDPPMRPRRRRPPPPPPSALGRGLRGPLPSSPRRRRHPRGKVHAMRTPIVPDMPRRTASCGSTGRAHAVNGPFGINRRPMVLPAPARERDLPTRVTLSTNFKRRPSSRRRRASSQRSLRLQELLQCPVCLTPYIEPRLLPCGHTYCDECLNRLIENDNDIVTCPECRKQHVVPVDGAFPSNFVVRNLLEEQGLSTGPRAITSSTLPLSAGATAKCTTCETFAPLRLCRHCNFMVCDRCLRSHQLGSNNESEFSKRSNIYSGKLIQFYVAVRKITRNSSQVKRLTIDMPIGNYLRDTCEVLIQRIIDREQLELIPNQLVLEFGDKRLRHQRTLASYGVQNGDLLFLFNPDQRLNFLAYEDEENSLNSSSNFPPPPPSTLPNRENQRLRANSFNSSTSDIRTTTTSINDIYSNRQQNLLSPISDHDDDDGVDNYSSSYSSES